MSDRERTKAGPDADTAEFAAFYRATVTDLVGFLISQGAQLADAADIAQATLIKAHRRWDTITHHRAWSFRVASRELIRALTTVEDPTAEPAEPSPLLRTSAPDDWVEQQETVRLLAMLPPRQRQVMAWTIYGFTPAEIAVELRIDPAAVRASLMKARRTLATALAGGGADD